jgi:hypothetical protein
LVLGAFAAPAAAQFGDSGPRYPGLVPSVRPAAAEEPAPTHPQVPALPPLPSGRPPAAVSSLEEMTAPLPAAGDPAATLNGRPMEYAPGVPVGSYPSPYYVDGPGCCGPRGADGRVGYDVYTYSGVNFVFGPGLPARLSPGWTVGGGARTLFFDATHTTAWTVDLGLSYTHNAAPSHSTDFLFLRRSTGPDQFAPAAIRELHRESFNFNLGRDWWLWGAGNTGGCQGTNLRVGGWLGGRWGSAHVDQIPLDEVMGYSRRQNVFLGVVLGGHATVDVPMGGWILSSGVRVEYGYDWMNIVPPLQGNLNNINIQLTVGVRY